jgi:hypothetical protein
LEKKSEFSKEAETVYREANRLSTGLFLIFLSEFFLQVRIPLGKGNNAIAIRGSEVQGYLMKIKKISSTKIQIPGPDRINACSIYYPLLKSRHG